MWVIAERRFNNHDPGDVFDVKQEDGEVFCAEGCAREAKEDEVTGARAKLDDADMDLEELKAKGPDKPEKDKAKKNAPKKK